MGEKDIDFKYSIFSILYKKDDNPCFIRDELDWRPMNGEARQALEAPFEEEEIQVVVFDSGNIKSPRPDGMTREFYKNSWNILKSELIELLVV